MVEYRTLDMGNVLSTLATMDAVKTARLNRESAIADRDQQAEEQQRLISARQTAWNTGGANLGELPGLAPQEAAAIRGHFTGLAEKQDAKALAAAQENIDMMGKLFAWVKTQPDPAKAYTQARENLPPDWQQKAPPQYDPAFVDMMLARSMSIADIFDQATASKQDAQFASVFDRLGQPAAGPAAPAPDVAPTMPPGAPPVGPQQPSSGPSQQAAYAYSKLARHGLSPAAAAGVVGNLMQESGANLNPSSWNAQEGALGIAQWREDRRVKLVQFAEAHGTDPTDFDTQIDFIVHELGTTERAAGEKLAQATTPQEAAAIFDKFYERSSGQHIDKRVQNAAMVHSAFGGQDFGGAPAEAGPAAAPGGLDPRLVSIFQAAGMMDKDDARYGVLMKAAEIIQEQGKAPDLPTSAQEFQFGQENPAYNKWLLDTKKAGASQVNIGAKEQAAAGQRDIATQTITTAAQRAREIATADSMMSPRTGVMGEVAANVPSSQAAELRRQVAVLTSNASMQNLTAMRQASPTGGALGAVSDRENQMLADASGALAAAASKPDFLRALENYELTLLMVVHGPEAGQRIFNETRPADTPQPEGAGGGEGTPENPVPVSTVEEANSLPSGTYFLDPMGNVRVKP